MNFEIVVATNNEHKMKEIRAILSPYHITVYSMNDLNLHPKEVEENGKDYYENALIKANALKELTSMPIIADDSGLEIVAMDNKPGVNTARFAKECGGHKKAMEYIIKEIAGKDRSATFKTCIVLLNVEKDPLVFFGELKGQISDKLEGENNFGYDPFFISDEFKVCNATLTMEQKNSISHRGKALKKMLTYLLISKRI